MGPEKMAKGGAGVFADRSLVRIECGCLAGGSGAAASFGTATALVAMIPPIGIPALAGAAFVTGSRFYLGDHSPRTVCWARPWASGSAWDSDWLREDSPPRDQDNWPALPARGLPLEKGRHRHPDQRRIALVPMVSHPPREEKPSLGKRSIGEGCLCVNGGDV